MMKVKHIVALAIIAVVVLSIAVYLPHSHEDKTKLKVIYTGSLFVSFRDVVEQFESEHPEFESEHQTWTCWLRGTGAYKLRHVTEWHDDLDVVAVADASLIPDMMYPSMRTGM